MKNTIIILISAILFGYVFGYMEQANRIEQLEYEIDDIKADYYNDGFYACLEQF